MSRFHYFHATHLSKRNALLEKLKDYLNSISPLAPSAWEEVKPLFSLKVIPKGANYIEAGKFARNIGFLESGILRAYFRNTEGATYNKHFFKAPCFVGGYASLITGTPNQIIQEALTTCHIWVVDYQKFTALYDRHQDLERIARKLAEQFFVQKEQREVELVMLNADERYLIFQREFPELEQLIPQYHIASYLGVTPTQLSRIRRKLADG